MLEDPVIFLCALVGSCRTITPLCFQIKDVALVYHVGTAAANLWPMAVSLITAALILAAAPSNSSVQAAKTAYYSGARRVANTSFVALRFHKVASTTFKSVLAQGLQPSYMEHETLAAYRAGGLPTLRCLGAPTAPKVVYVALFREPASRILSALHFYSSFASAATVGSMGGGGLLHGGLGRRMQARTREEQKAFSNTLVAARAWLRDTPCEAYTAQNVSSVLKTFANVKMGENIGAGMLLSEYSYYFRIKVRVRVPLVATPPAHRWPRVCPHLSP